jgi:hypothetical protein
MPSWRRGFWKSNDHCKGKRKKVKVKSSTSIERNILADSFVSVLSFLLLPFTFLLFAF